MRSYPAKLHRIIDPDLTELSVSLGFGQSCLIRVKLAGFDPPPDYRDRLIDVILHWVEANDIPENDFPLSLWSDAETWVLPAVYSGEVFGKRVPGSSLNLALHEHCRAAGIPGF